MRDIGLVISESLSIVNYMPPRGPNRFNWTLYDIEWATNVTFDSEQAADSFIAHVALVSVSHVRMCTTNASEGNYANPSVHFEIESGFGHSVGFDMELECFSRRSRSAL
jgi:hypothetical protein